MHEINRADLADMDRILASSNPARYRAVDERRPLNAPLRGVASACSEACHGTSLDRVTITRIDTAGMNPAECCTEIGAEPVRWNEGPDYPRGTSPIIGALVLLVSGCISVAALLHLAAWLGWLS